MPTLQREDMTTRTLTIVDVVTKTVLVANGTAGGGGGGSGGGSITVEGPGGSPSVANVNTIQIAGGTVEDKTGGVVQISVGVAGMGSQTKATFLAAPTASDGAPTFRVIAAGDLPTTVAFQNATNNFTTVQAFSGVLRNGQAGPFVASIDLNAGVPFDSIILFTCNEGTFTGAVVAQSFAGDGSGITNINADNIDSGTLDSTQLPTTGVTDATYGSATASFVGAVDKYGRITSAANKTITPSWGNLVSVPANVDAFGNLVSVADSIGYFTGSGTMKVTTFTTQARNLLDDTTEGEMQTTIGGTTIGRAFFTATNPSAVTFPRANADNSLSLLSASDYRTAIGTKIGTDVQAYHANLAALAGLTGEADRGVYFTGAGALALYTQTSFARNLLDDADAATARGTLGVAVEGAPFFWEGEVTDGTSVLTSKAQFALTINGIYGAKVSTGTGKLTFEINGTPITGLEDIEIDSTATDFTATAANTVAINDRVTLVRSDGASWEDLEFTMKYTR